MKKALITGVTGQDGSYLSELLIEKGYAAMERKYDGEGRVSEESYFGTDNEPVESTAKYHRVARVWKDEKHASSEAWFDTEDQPKAVKDTGRRFELELAGKDAVPEMVDCYNAVCADNHGALQKFSEEARLMGLSASMETGETAPVSAILAWFSCWMRPST